MHTGCQPVPISKENGMEQERFLVTGGLGCIGAWVVRNLVQEGARVTVFDLAGDPHRLKLLLPPEDLQQVNFLSGDVRDLDAVTPRRSGKPGNPHHSPGGAAGAFL
jgi:nucleoside-diphosphate-sugar epimerase